MVPEKPLTATVMGLDHIHEQIIEARLRVNSADFHYAAGQYIELLTKIQELKPYSIANAPNDNRIVHLHIRTSEQTASTIETLSLENTVQLIGPFGNCVYEQYPNEPLVLVAGGTGYVPFNALTEYASALPQSRPITLIWGGKHSSDLYYLDKVQQLQKTMQRFEFYPVIEEPETHWPGMQGTVVSSLVERFQHLEGHTLIASGPEAMVLHVRDTAVQLGIDPEHVFSDTFTYQPKMIQC